MNGYEIVYPFKPDSTGNKRELSTNVNGIMCMFLVNQLIIRYVNSIRTKE